MNKPDSYACTLVVDVDDFEVQRRRHGDLWAQARIGAAVAAIHDARAGSLADITWEVSEVPPDSWVLTGYGGDPDRLAVAGRRLAERARDLIRDRAGVTACIGLSDVHPLPSGVGRSVVEATKCQQHKIVMGGDRVIAYRDLPTSAPPLRPAQIEVALAEHIRDRDAGGASVLFSDWIEEHASLDGVTPEVLRSWLAAELFYALDAARRWRLSDGSPDWVRHFSELRFDRFTEMSEIPERSYLALWVGSLLSQIITDQRGTTPSQRTLDLVEAYLAHHYAEDVALGTVARALYLSSYYISHLFRLHLNTTFPQYLTELRIRRARELLTGTARAVEEIAADVGYRTPRHFRALFKKAVGVTPTEYRRANVTHGKPANG